MRHALGGGGHRLRGLQGHTALVHPDQGGGAGSTGHQDQRGCPGNHIATPIIADTIRSRGKAFLDAIPMPLGRVADPREQATVIAFLGSADASYLSGQIIWVDGGY